MGFDYNTQRKRMALPEYGRNVQKMVDYIKTIEDREERTRAAKTVITVMANLNNSHFRDEGDFNHKLWDHLALIADFDLDIDSPYSAPERKSANDAPNTIPYNQGNTKFLHYGRLIEEMIKHIAGMEDGEEKDYLINLVINQMKKSYITWNRGQVSDDVIFADFVLLSEGKITIPSSIKLMDAKELMQTNNNNNNNKKKQQNGKKQNGKNRNKSNNNNKKKAFFKH